MELLIDADIMVYEHAAVNQQDIEWEEGVISSILTPEIAIFYMKQFIDNLMEKTNTTDVICCFSSDPGFRYEVLPTYKHNRKGKERPKLLGALTDFVFQNYKVQTIPKLEADDVLGILATQSPRKYIVASIDKDLLQIQGKHYNWRKDKFNIVTKEEGERLFYLQALIGDPTDGYKGCPGIGPKRGAKLLEDLDLEEMWEVIVKAYEKKGLTEEDALQQARVARILRVKDYDFKKCKPKLWKPKKGR